MTTPEEIPASWLERTNQVVEAQTGHREAADMSDPERDRFDIRPTGDEMLARIEAESGGGRGHLRVYLGMAPGVGKTYKMLDEGHRRLARGTDLVVGFVEAHGRPRTTELLDGLATNLCNRDLQRQSRPHNS